MRTIMNLNIKSSLDLIWILFIFTLIIIAVK